MNFDFATAGRIVFGAGSFARSGPLLGTFGRRALVVAGRDKIRAQKLADLLQESNPRAELAAFQVDGEPTVEIVRRGLAAAREGDCDFVIGFGGGSVLDTGKAIAALLTNPGDVIDYLEIIGPGKPLTHPSAPFIAIPTTAGTGAEVTRNAVLCSPEHQTKVSLRSPFMLPRLALVDPELTYSMPPGLTAATGLDALTQLIEAFVSNKSNPMTDGLCREGIKRAAAALPRAVENGHDQGAREDMAFASLLGGMALANAGLGVVHGLASPLGGMFGAPHGALCAALLPHGLFANIRALRHRAPRHPALDRFQELAALLSGQTSAVAEDAWAWASELCLDLNIPALTTFGVAESHLEGVAEKARQTSSMRGNPIELETEEIVGVLRRAL